MLQHPRFDLSDAVAEVEQAGAASQRVDAPGAQIDCADPARLAVRDVQDVVLQRQTGWLRQRGFGARSVDERFASISGDRLDGPFSQIEHGNLVRSGERDIQLAVA